MHIPKGEHVEWCREYSCEGCVEDSFDAGYLAALDAAEQAVEAALNTGLSNSSDNALYFYELDEDDPTLGYNVTFPKGSLIAAIRALREKP